MANLLSIVIPTLNAAATLDRLLVELARTRGAVPLEIVVADGGSGDDTQAAAARNGARLVESPRGRGVQFAAGAKAALGDWLLFLHADTVPAPGWAEEVARFVAAPANAKRAAYFRFSTDDTSKAAERLKRFVAWRCRCLALPYGDQGLLIGRAFYDSLGGYRPFPLMEDVNLIRRIGRRRLVGLHTKAVTSARRYRRDGWLLRPLRNLFCLSLYFLGVPPRVLTRLYG